MPSVIRTIGDGEPEVINYEIGFESAHICVGCDEDVDDDDFCDKHLTDDGVSLCLDCCSVCNKR